MKIQITPGKIIATLLLTGFAACVALADTEGIVPTFTKGSTSCVGTYYAYAKMTNSAGSIWITPPTNTTNGTFTDISTNISTNYTSTVVVMRKKDLVTWCGTNSVTFPATNSTSYQMVSYVTSQPPPTNGQLQTLQIVWH